MTRFAPAALSICAFGLAGPAAAEMRPGQWEATMTMEMPGMPMAMPPVTMSRCVKAEDIGKAPPIPSESNCKITDYKTDAAGAKWNMACTGANAMTGSGSIIYSGDAYSGEMNMQVNRPGDPAMNVKQTLKGKRLGDC